MTVEDPRRSSTRNGSGTFLGLLVLVLALAAGAWLFYHARSAGHAPPRPIQAPAATSGST